MVVVLVTCDAPGDRLDEVLRAVGRQDYPNLAVLVVDAGTTDVTERVHAVLPEATVRRVPGARGFGAAANVVLDIVAGAAFYVFAHDDAAPEPGAVRALVAAAERWQADVVGPKLVEWDDPRRFTQFGVTVDRVGVALPYVQRGELDQGQHDGLRDVFAVPGGFTLVRAERFAEIGGFDEAIDMLGDDLSLAWRTRVAGGRVVVAAGARVRHAEAFATRGAATTASRLAARHRVRVLLTSYRLPTLAAVLPQALLLSVVEAVGALVTARPGRARAALGAWLWNLWRLPSLVAARRHVARFRRVRDREVRRYQVRGLVGPRLRLLRVGGDGRAGAVPGSGSRRVAAVPVRGRMETDPAAWSPGTALVATALAAVVLFGSRHLLTRAVPVVGEMVPPGGGPGDLLRAWAGGWRTVGLGADGATPSLAGALGLLGTLVGGHPDLARTLATVGLVPLGIVGAHRLVGPTGSKRAQVAAAVAYAALPLPYDAFAEGRWGALAAYAGAPWMLGRLARASGVTPFGPAPPPGEGPILPGGAADDLVVHHRLWKHVVVTGAVTALVGLVLPQAPALLLLAGAGLVLGSLLAGELRGVLRLATATVGGAVVAAALLLPTTLDVLRTPGAAEAWVGASARTAGLSAAEVLGFRSGPLELRPLALGLLGAAAVPVLVGRRWRLGWAVRGWTTAVVAWGAVWAHEQGWIAGRFPDRAAVLALAAAGLALAVGLGMAAVEHDVRGRSWRFGLRRLVVAGGTAALAAASVTPLEAALDGWWGMPREDVTGVLGPVDEDVAATPSRVLWVGQSELLPGRDGWPLGDHLAYTASTGAAVPGVADLWPTTAAGASERLGDALDLARRRATSRLGRVLAPLGVQYVAVPRHRAPTDDLPADPAADRAADELVTALSEQLDLEQVGVDRGVVVFRNTVAAPLRHLAETGAAGERDVGAAGADPDLRPVLVRGDGREASGRLPAGATVVQASTASDRWELTVDGERAAWGVADGWADRFTVERGGEAHLVHRTTGSDRAVRGVQVALWVVAVGVALRMRFGMPDPPAAGPGRRRGGATPEGRGSAAAGVPAPTPPAPDEPAEPAEGAPVEPDRRGEPEPVGSGVEP